MSIKIKSSTLKTRKHKITNKNDKNDKNDNSHNSHNNHNSKTINNNDKNINNSIDYTNRYSIISVNSNFSKKHTLKKRKKYKTFLSKEHTLRRMKRILPKTEDRIIDYLDDNRREFIQGKIIKDHNLEKYIFNNDKLNCICENLYKKHLDKECKCNQMKPYSSQVKSDITIHSIICKKQLTPKRKIDKIGQLQMLKVVPLSNYYMKLRKETYKYMFIECDKFTIQTLINRYVYKELPNNTINIFHSGICNKSETKLHEQPHIKDISIKGKTHGYNLMEELDLGSGREFLDNIINGYYDKEFKITNEDTRYLMVCNYLLQIVLIIGHLQSCSLEFFHGDYKPENVFVKSCPLDKIKRFSFDVFGKSIKVKNMGFVVLIANFDMSSLSLHSHLKNKKKYRIISEISFQPLLKSYVNNIIKNYGYIDSDNFQGEIKIEPTITGLRSTGVKLYRDFDVYTFFINLIETDKIRNYMIKHRINTTIMSFMSHNFKDTLFKISPKSIKKNDSLYIVIKILKHIKEPLPIIFNNDYLNMLRNLNYKLFKM